jgi:hypothetical protein
MRACGYANLSLLWLMCVCVPLCQAAAPEHGGVPLRTRQQLIGAWRLVGIEYSDRSGPIVDPFYQAGSVGIIIYDSSGWMSVHIAAPHRKAWEVPASRLPSDAAVQDTEFKAAAFDTYYAYFGIWDFDPAKSVVTHHLKSSLIPAETGLDYAQKVTLENGRLIFTGQSGTQGQETTRIKVWERVSDIAK